jgi:rubrerythrin
MHHYVRMNIDGKPSNCNLRFESVKEQTQSVRTILSRIREDAQRALTLLDESKRDQRSLAWKCTACGHIKHFTRLVLAEVAAPCPKCRCEKFDPV